MALDFSSTTLKACRHCTNAFNNVKGKLFSTFEYYQPIARIECRNFETYKFKKLLEQISTKIRTKYLERISAQERTEGISQERHQLCQMIQIGGLHKGCEESMEFTDCLLLLIVLRRMLQFCRSGVRVLHEFVISTQKRIHISDNYIEN